MFAQKVLNWSFEWIVCIYFAFLLFNVQNNCFLQWFWPQIRDINHKKYYILTQILGYFLKYKERNIIIKIQFIYFCIILPQNLIESSIAISFHRFICWSELKIKLFFVSYLHYFFLSYFSVKYWQYVCAVKEEEEV